MYNDVEHFKTSTERYMIYIGWSVFAVAAVIGVLYSIFYKSVIERVGKNFAVAIMVICTSLSLVGFMVAVIGHDNEKQKK
jgi:predicted PurR-regulated permease PerM